MRYAIILLLVLSTIIIQAQEQEESKLNISGFLSGMPSLSTDKEANKFSEELLIHNRFDIFYKHKDWLNIEVGLRNRFFYGNSLNELFYSGIDKDQGIADLSLNYLKNGNTFFNTSIDRLFVQITEGKLEINIGRQRINWGISTVWNPNDIFNAYSFIDFDYTKRGGTDAVRVKYFSSSSSVIEVAANIDSNKKINIAAYNRFSYMGSDLQFSSGIYKSEDLYLGAGFTSFLNSLGINGEASIFIPYKDIKEREKTFSTTLALDYLFSNSIYLSAEILYNSGLENISASNFIEYMQNTNLETRRLSLSPLSYFLSATYPASPIINTSISGIYFSNISAYYIIPSIDISVSNNNHLSIIAQVFSAKLEKERLANYSVFIRLSTYF